MESIADQLADLDRRIAYLENPVSNRLTGLLATHPSMDERVDALQRYAGALDTDAGPPAPSR